MTTEKALRELLDELEVITTSYEMASSDECQRLAAEKAECRAKIIALSLPETVGEPVAKVADVHFGSYTLEWTNGQLPEGTELYAAPPSQPAQGWVIAKQIAVLDDSRAVRGKAIGYALCKHSAVFPSFDATSAEIKRLKLPVGWVAIEVRRLLAAARAEAEKLQAEVDRRFGIGGELIIARRQRDEAIAEADELARRVSYATAAGVLAAALDRSEGKETASEIIARVRAEMEKERGNG